MSLKRNLQQGYQAQKEVSDAYYTHNDSGEWCGELLIQKVYMEVTNHPPHKVKIEAKQSIELQAFSPATWKLKW